MQHAGCRIGGFAYGSALPSRMSGFVFDYAGTGRIQDAGLKMWIPDFSGMTDKWCRPSTLR